MSMCGAKTGSDAGSLKGGGGPTYIGLSGRGGVQPGKVEGLLWAQC